MNNFYKGGRGMACGHSDGVTELRSDQSYQTPPKQEKIKCLRLTAYSLLLFVSMFSLSDAWAQSSDIREAAERQDTVRPLQIGDTIPEELWNLPLQVINHDEDKEIITLAEYRDKKLIILDFWATWCGSCISAFPKIDRIAEENKADLAVLAISEEKPALVQAKLPQLPRVNITYLLSKKLRPFFPFHYLPHYVWISNGAVIAISSSAEVSLENVKHVLDTEESPFGNFKNDLMGFDKRLPFHTNADLQPYVDYSAIFLKDVEGIGGAAGQVTDTIAGTTRTYFTNMGMYALYRAISPYSKLENVYIEKSDLDGTVAVEPPKYCYEQIYRVGIPAKEQRLKMQRDLDNYFNKTSKVERVSTEIWKISGQPENIETDVFNRMRLVDLCYLFNSTRKQGKDAPILIVQDNGRLYVPSDLRNLSNVNDIKDALMNMGFKFYTEKVLIDMLLVNDKNQ